MRWAARHLPVLVTVAAVEGYFFLRYAQQGALFHYWLHALLGGYLGVGALAVARLRGRGRRTTGWEAGFTGHLYSAVPDVLFLTAGLLHVAWMDVFAVHITAHFLWPSALPAALVLWSLAVLALLLTTLQRPRAAAGVLGASLALLAVAVLLRSPLPSSLQQVRDQEARRGLTSALASFDWVCSVGDPADTRHPEGPSPGPR